MTSNEELITEARKAAQVTRSVGRARGVANTLDRLADALETVSKKRVIQAEEELSDLPEDTILQITEDTEFRGFEYLQSYGKDSWILLDPSDRDDGEYALTDAVVWRRAHGFTEHPVITTGRITVLYTPPAVGEEPKR